MLRYRFTFALLSLLALFTGCNDSALEPQPRKIPLAQTKSPNSGESTLNALAATSLKCDDILQQVREVNRKVGMPSAEFRAGHAEPLKLDKDCIKKKNNGFVIELPSGSPIPTPVVHQGRIYVGTQDGKLVCINTGDKQLTGWPMTGRDSGHGNVAFKQLALSQEPAEK